jgi:alpha-beta hydrolase superfamily lysophospholipase
VALDTRLASSPALEVVEAVATSRADLGADAPDDETSAALRFPVASGHLRLPEYRRGDEPMVLGADGAPEPDGVTEPGFLVVLPARGTAPYPVVLFQHGGGQSPRELFRFAGPLARAGFAFVAIDLPEHGHRAPPGGGSDLSFLDFERPLRTRENFRQAAADHLAVLTGLDALEAGVGGALGVSEPDLLDGTRVFYMGLSLGGITGSLTSQVSRELSGAALFVAGAGYPELLQYGLFTAPISRVVRSPQPLPWALLGAVSIALDGADPFAYAQQVDDLAAPPIPVVQLHAIDDPLISDEASEQWARAFGATLVRPWHHEVATLTAADLPHADGFVRGDARATRAYVQCPMPGVPSAGRHGGLIRTTYAQELVAHCFAGVAQGGACEVIDTGFAD